MALSTRITIAVAVAFLVGAVASSVTGGTGSAATKLLVSAAAMSVGGLVGFLFGVPRMAARAGDDGPSANTNLEQVSDWLTKILLGAGLVQLGAVGSGLGALFSDVGSLFGTGESATVTAGAVLVYFAGLGFLTGWLFTRIFLGQTLAEADRWLRSVEALAEEAEKRGDSDQAQALRRQVRTGHVDPKSVWETIRTSVLPGPARVRMLDEHFGAPLTAEEQALDKAGVARLFTQGDEGSRMEALKVMFHRPETVVLPCVVDAIDRSRSGHEQYQALRVARKAVPNLSTEERATLLSVVREAARPGRWIAADGSRAAVAVELLGALTA